MYLHVQNLKTAKIITQRILGQCIGEYVVPIVVNECVLISDDDSLSVKHSPSNGTVHIQGIRKEMPQ